jgi:hypothetical protein
MAQATRRTAPLLALLLASVGLLIGSGTASAQSRTYAWKDIDCRQSRIAAWPGLTCRATDVVTNDSRIGQFRQWAAFGRDAKGYYVHMFLWEARNGYSYVSADDTTADFVRWMFENGKQVSDVSPVKRIKDADYVTFRDDKVGRACVGFRRLGRFQRGGYDQLSGGILCAPPGQSLSENDIGLFVERVRLQPAGMDKSQ